MEKLELHTLTTYKTGVDIKKSLKQDKQLFFAPLELDENAMATYPTEQNKPDAEKRAIEENHAILLMPRAYKYKYGKLIKNMKMTS